MKAEEKPVQEAGFEQVCFGLSREIDEQSLAIFLRLFNREELLQTLIPRLEDDEIAQLVQQLTGVLHKHLREKEYHELFLGDYEHQH
ncbi:MAG: hypothetical protein D3924_04155 [Candidatus Electrothrix sp. AR4]|nr:hypothetical protein [Candidatus Electrothrix sp. AR4]